ncbi:methyl-CpG-binding domain protein 5-like [Lampris incognitus]|uniref:methyl-CpG-binding domain protein 5-like n=1 Tax=Lampris incognitus TaxID=2546036 RepID=UPI0024B51F38|nr:methyl-CpG-binding domain protein 5-like [Lampris incognitus]
MNRTMKCGGQSDVMSPAEVPIGWQRKIHQSRVVYISPSGSVLACLEEAKTYLLSDGTCKCGLECPLIPHKVFNFDAGAAVKQRTAEDAKTDSDVTKLCIHKRKIIAVATLHRSMGSKLPTAPIGAGKMSSLNNHQAKRNDVLNGSSNNVSLDGKKSYKMPISGHRHYQHELGSPPPYTSHVRARHCGGGGGGDHNAQRSPYRNHRSGFLTPPSSTSCSLLHYDDGNPSHEPDPLRSPDPSVLSFHRTLSPGSAHKNGECFTPLSPPHIMVRSSPSGTKLSFAVGGMTNVPLSPSLNTKSPNRQKSPCSLPPNVNYQRNALSACYTQPLPPCVIQKKPVPSSEKDPLGILDPIPSKNHIQDQIVSTQSSLQFHFHPQVSCMSATIPPSIVPLPSNLPLPVVKSAPVGHGLRCHYPTPSSVSSSPITSPVHIAGPAPIRVEETFNPQSSVSSSTQFGNCPLSMRMQMSKLPSRSPRTSMASPRTSLPLQHLKEAANQLEGGVSRHPYSLCPPALGCDSVSQSNHSLGGASQQLLDQQNPSSFPASSLLSAAAKAQLDNHNKVAIKTSTVEAQAGGVGQAGLVGGGRQMYSDGYSISDPKYLPSSGLNFSDNQSGKAALRDKLMAQQRDVLLKHKTPRKTGGDTSSFSVNIQHRSGSSSYVESMKRLLHQDTLPINTSVGHPVQSISHQSSQNGLSHAGHHPAKSGNSPFFDECAPQISALQNVHGPHQLRDRVEISSHQSLGKRNDNTEVTVVTDHSGSNSHAPQSVS